MRIRTKGAKSEGAKGGIRHALLANFFKAHFSEPQKKGSFRSSKKELIAEVGQKKPLNFKIDITY